MKQLEKNMAIDVITRPSDVLAVIRVREGR